jgi:hypothetical protein
VLPKIAAIDSGYFISYYDEADGYKMYLQFIDPKGNVMWDNPVIVTDYPQDSWISDYTLVTDDRFAYIFFSDVRNGTSDKDIFGYKFNSDGSFLWDSAGVELIIASSDYDSELAPKATVMPNGEVVSAWSKMDADGYTVAMQWLASDGAKIWPDGNIVAEAGLRYYEPNLLPATDSTVYLVYIYQNGMYGDRQIHVQQIGKNGMNVWDEAVVVTDNSGIGMGRTFSVHPGSNQSIYITWYGDPDFNGANDVFTQKLNLDGSVSFQANGLNLSPNDVMNQTMPNCAGEDPYGNAVYIWQEVNGSNTGDLIKTQLVSPAGELILGESADIVTDQHNLYGEASYKYGQVYCPAKIPGNVDLKMVIFNYQTNDTSIVSMPVQFEYMSEFKNGQFVIADIFDETVRAQNITFRGERGVEPIISESTLSAFANINPFHPDTLFYYLAADSAHFWNDFASQMNIYQSVELLDSLSMDAGNYRINVYAENGSYSTYQFSFVNEPGTEVLSTYSYSLLTHVDSANRYVFAEMQLVKEQEEYIDLELTPGARIKIGDKMDVDYAMMNDTIHQFLWMKTDIDSAFMDFKIVDYNGYVEDWTLIMTYGGGGIHESTFGGNVFPVPATNRLFVESVKRIEEVQLIDLQGNVCMRESVNANKTVISVSNVPTGIYFLQVIDGEGIKSRKIVVE